MEQQKANILSALDLSGREIQLDNFVESFHKDMKAGLEGQEDADMSMFASYIQGEMIRLPLNEPVAVIDAGGTNLRVALMELKSDYTLSMKDFKKYSMPGIDREVSAEEFFRTLAEYAYPVVKQTSRVGFCFSYAMRKLSAYDGVVRAWTKEVKAPEVLNRPICENLKKALADKGCGDVKITIFNDTVATLLAARTFNPARGYSGYMGLIMGTGLNMAYVEDNGAIKKIKDLPEGRQAVNMEAAMFSRFPKGRVDVNFINATEAPRVNQLEKISSGCYLGPLWGCYLKEAAEQGLFSEAAAGDFKTLGDIQTSDMDSFLRNPEGEHPVGKILQKGLREDSYVCWVLADTLLDRASRVVAGVLSAVVLWSGLGEDPLKPVCICVDGSTFYKLHGYKEKAGYYLKSYLEEQEQRWIELVTVDNAPMAGAVVAGLTN